MDNRHDAMSAAELVKMLHRGMKPDPSAVTKRDQDPADALQLIKAVHVAGKAAMDAIRKSRVEAAASSTEPAKPPRGLTPQLPKVLSSDVPRGLPTIPKKSPAYLDKLEREREVKKRERWRERYNYP